MSAKDNHIHVRYSHYSRGVPGQIVTSPVSRDEQRLRRPETGYDNSRLVWEQLESFFLQYKNNNNDYQSMPGNEGGGCSTFKNPKKLNSTSTSYLKFRHYNIWW